MIPRLTRTLITTALAAWCIALPVLAQACPCALAVVSDSIGSEVDQPIVTPRLAGNHCCGRCVSKPFAATIEFSLDHQDPDSRSCQCDRGSTFQLFRAEVSNSDVSISNPQPTGTIAYWLPESRTGTADFERPPPVIHSHQTKLASLGVWRL